MGEVKILQRILGIAEVAELLGVQRGTVAQLRWQGKMPAADWPLKGGPVWLEQTIRMWAAETGRTIKGD